MIRKVPERFRMRSMATVIMSDDGEAACRCQPGKSLIAFVVFPESVKYLNDTAYVALGSPVCSANRVIVGCLNFKRPGLHAVHSGTT